MSEQTEARSRSRSRSERKTPKSTKSTSHLLQRERKSEPSELPQALLKQYLSFPERSQRRAEEKQAQSERKRPAPVPEVHEVASESKIPRAVRNQMLRQLLPQCFDDCSSPGETVSLQGRTFWTLDVESQKVNAMLTVQYDAKQQHYHIANVCTSPTARRRGMMRRILGTVLERMSAQVSELYLEVVEGSPAHQLYQSMGFVKTARRQQDDRIEMVYRYTRSVVSPPPRTPQAKPAPIAARVRAPRQPKAPFIPVSDILRRYLSRLIYRNRITSSRVVAAASASAPSVAVDSYPQSWSLVGCVINSSTSPTLTTPWIAQQLAVWYHLDADDTKELEYDLEDFSDTLFVRDLSILTGTHIAIVSVVNPQGVPLTYPQMLAASLTPGQVQIQVRLNMDLLTRPADFPTIQQVLLLLSDFDNPKKFHIARIPNIDALLVGRGAAP